MSVAGLSAVGRPRVRSARRDRDAAAQGAGRRFCGATDGESRARERCRLRADRRGATLSGWDSRLRSGAYLELMREQVADYEQLQAARVAAASGRAVSSCAPAPVRAPAGCSRRRGAPTRAANQASADMLPAARGVGWKIWEGAFAVARSALAQSEAQTGPSKSPARFEAAMSRLLISRA